MTATFLRGLGALCALGTLAFTAPEVAAQGAGCKGLLFSTSEDFTMQRAEGPDGNPIVSDGDLLAFDAASGMTSICRRNRELVQQFDVSREDLGLDAVAALDEKPSLIAFSTELDSPHGNFTAGDLLFTDGTVIPNAALMVNFNIRHDIGLDAVAFQGDPERWFEVLEKIRSIPPGDVRQNPGIIAEIVLDADLDILFSTEGTAPDVKAPAFIDGDLLSLSGAIFRANSTLLPNLPAGIPVKGVDFGLDAYTYGANQGGDGALQLFSTEIDGRGEVPFTDGDALVPGPGLWALNRDLLKSLQPATFDLGLDALHLPPAEFACGAPSITRVSGVEVGNIDGQGLADHGGLTTRPFGSWLRIQAALPVFADCPILGNYEFRVELDDGTGFPALNDPNTLAIPGGWLRQLDGDPGIGIDCANSVTNPKQLYAPDADGWFNLADYRRFDECGEDASAAVWNSSALAQNVEAGDPPTTVRFRIVMREIGSTGSLPIAPPVAVRLDNNQYSLPTSKDMPLTGDISMTFAVASASDANVTDCDVSAGSSDVILALLGRARDQHFWRYTLRWSGGNAVGWHSINPVEGTPPVARDSVFDDDGSDGTHISLGGTQPGNSTTVHLSDFNLTQAHIAATGGQPPIECGYVVELTAWDRTIVGSFSPANNSFGTTVRRQYYPLAFCFKEA